MIVPLPLMTSAILCLLRRGKPDVTGLFPTRPPPRQLIEFHHEQPMPGASCQDFERIRGRCWCCKSDPPGVSSASSIVRLEVWAIQNVLMPLERLYDGRPGGNDKSNKHNCTDE